MSRETLLSLPLPFSPRDGWYFTGGFVHWHPAERGTGADELSSDGLDCPQTSPTCWAFLGTPQCLV